MNRSSSLMRAGAAAALSLFGLSAQAGTVELLDCNIDAYNLTGQTANDFDVRLPGMGSSSLTQIYGGSRRFFPQVTVTDEVDGTRLHFFGAEVADGGAVHIGYEIKPPGVVPTAEQNWSSNGAPLGAPVWGCTRPMANFRQAEIVNPGTDTAYVRIRAQFVSGPISLADDLIRDSALDLGAMVVTPVAIQLTAGQSANYGFDDFGHGSYVTIFDVCGDAACAKVMETVFNAVQYTPEPGSGALLAGALAAAALASRARRPGAASAVARAAA